MPFLKEIEEHENIPKITLNPDNKEEQHTSNLIIEFFKFLSENKIN